MNVEYAILKHPLPRNFAEWYPYAKPSVMLPGNAHWLDSMQRVIQDRMPGVIHHFSTARDVDKDAYIGVAWLGISPSAPEIAHFGWFLVEEACRGTGIGRETLNRAIAFLDERGVEVVMLPTRLSTVHARAMYARRGFVDLIAEHETGKCWMIRGPKDHFDGYFVTRGPISMGPMEFGDWFAFDYLMNHERVVSRLYPVGLTGERRALSLTRAAEWKDSPREIAIRRRERLCGAILLKEADGGTDADFYTPDEALADEAAVYLNDRAPRPVRVAAASRDEMKSRALKRSGMRTAETFREKPYGKDAEEEFVVWRAE